MKFIPYHRLEETPNIIVDGAANSHTVLTLSHWPHSGTPEGLKDDLSAQIVFRYLESPRFHISVEAVSNNHFDEDGLISLYSILNPGEALENREILIDIASVGDFGTYRYPESVRIFFILSALADKDKSSLPAHLFEQDYEEQTADLYRELLPRLPEIMRHPDSYSEFWKGEQARLERSEAAIRQGKVKIEEVPLLDLAIIRIPEEYTNISTIAVHNSTDRFRILTMTGQKYEFYYRYETWVQYISRRPLPRVDLNLFAERLTSVEESAGAWVFDGVENIVPYLRKRDDPESSISPDVFRLELEQYLKAAAAAWNPYD